MKDKSQEDAQANVQEKVPEPAPDKKKRDTKAVEAAQGAESAGSVDKGDAPTEYPAVAKLINGAAISHTIGGIYVSPYSESDAFTVQSSDEVQRIATDIAALAELYTHYASVDGGLVRLAMIEKD